MRAIRIAGLAPALAALLLISCRPSGPERLAQDVRASRGVSFTTSDGIRLSGRVFGHGSVGVVLSHMLPADQTSWWDFARRLAASGYRALTYDFRGYCPGGDAGCSKGRRDVSAIWRDVVAATAFLRSDGASRIVLIGASMGGTASLVAAAQPGIDVQAVVTLSAPTSIEGLSAGPDVLTQVDAAKLFIAGLGDPTGSADAAQQLEAWSPQPKRLDIVTSNDHGTDLLTGNQSGIVATTILEYLQEYAAP